MTQGQYNPLAWEALGPKWDCYYTKNGLEPRKLNIVKWIIEVKDELEWVLDAGCCTGYYLNKLRELGYKGCYQGIDITPNLIERAQGIHPSSNDYFLIMDIQEMTFPDATFDLSFSVGVLQHIPDHGKAIKELFRVSKKYVIISCYATDKLETEAKHDEDFLNFRFIKKDLIEHKPEDWRLIRGQRYAGHWQFMFKKKEHLE